MGFELQRNEVRLTRKVLQRYSTIIAKQKRKKTNKQTNKKKTAVKKHFNMELKPNACFNKHTAYMQFFRGLLKPWTDACLLISLQPLINAFLLNDKLCNYSHKSKAKL